MKYLLLLLFIACSKGSSLSYSPAIHNPDIDSYVLNFENTFNIEINFEVTLVKTLSANNQEAAAYCYKENGFKRVEILDSTPKYARKSYVFHELGHCALNLNHYDSDFDIMNSHPGYDVLHNPDKYIPKMLYNFDNNIY